MTKWTIVLLTAVVLVGCDNKNQSAQTSSSLTRFTPDSRQQSQSKEMLIQRGVAALNQKDIATAIQNFSQATTVDPSDPQPHFVLAEVYMRLNNLPKAIESFERVIQLQPDNGQAFFLLGVSYGLNGDRETAKKALERSAVIFQQKKDEENFKRAVVNLQQIMQVEEEMVSSNVVPGTINKDMNQPAKVK